MANGREVGWSGVLRAGAAPFEQALVQEGGPFWTGVFLGVASEMLSQLGAQFLPGRVRAPDHVGGVFRCLTKSTFCWDEGVFPVESRVGG